jgi:hypothetical protein
VGYGPKTLSKSGTAFNVLAVPGTERRKLGGLTIDWSTVPKIGGKNEKVTIAITGSPSGGTFTITYGGQTTGSIAYNATADVVETALEALSTIGNANVKVTLSGSTYTIEGVNLLAKTDLGAFTTTNSFTGGSSPNTTITVTQTGTPDGDYTMRDGTVVPAGKKILEAGTVLVKITATGLFGPADTAASDGRGLIDSGRIGDVFVLNSDVFEDDPGSDMVGDVLDAGVLYKARLLIGGTGQPGSNDLTAACPSITFA